MQKEILYTTAIDKNGVFININNAVKGENYFCPQCKTGFILKDSGNTGKGSKRPHFAHTQLTTNCTPEGVLHYSFKKSLISLLEKYKSEGKPFMINWACNNCFTNPNRGNLLANTIKIEEEYNMKECRPDIALLDQDGNVSAAIEIVVTHNPEEQTLLFYKRNRTTLIQVNLSSDEDVEKVEEKIRNPDIVTFCLKPECPSHMNPETERRLRYGIKKATFSIYARKGLMILVVY